MVSHQQVSIQPHTVTDPLNTIILAAKFLAAKFSLVGYARTGKSFMLEQAFPGQIIEPVKSKLRPMSGTIDLTLEGVPTSGPVCVDEAMAYSRESLINAAHKFSGRGMIFTFPALRLVEESGLHLTGKKVAIINLVSRNEFRPHDFEALERLSASLITVNNLEYFHD